MHLTRLFLSLWIIFAFFADPMLEISGVRHLFLARAVAEDGTFHVDRFAHASKGDLAFANGHYYSGGFPGVGFLLIPHAIAAKIISNATGFRPNQVLQLLAIIFFNAPIAALATVLLVRTLFDCGVDRARASLFGLIAALGSPLFFFTSKLSDYPLVMLLHLIIIRTTVLTQRHIIAGIALGLCALVNNLAVFLATLMIVITTPFFPLPTFARRWTFLILGSLPFLALRSHYLRTCFGSAFADPLAYSAARISVVDIYSDLGSRTAMIIAMLREIPQILWGLTFGDVGLFLFLPASFLAIFLFKERLPTIAKAGLFIALVNALAHCALIGGVWKGGASWGPRYMLYSIAPLMIFLAFCAQTVQMRVLFPLAAISIGINTVGVMYGYGTSILNQVGLFALGGPTTPIFRWLWLHWNVTPSPERIALVWEETPLIGHYYAFTHPSPFMGFLLLTVILALIWKPLITRKGK